MSKRRPLDAEEKAAWERVKATVKPLHPMRAAAIVPQRANPSDPAQRTVERTPPQKRVPTKARASKAVPPKVIPQSAPVTTGLDSHWDRRLKRGVVTPDFELDLHGLGMNHAYHRLDGALEQAISTGARTILLVTGRARDHDRASGEGRGAIRAAVGDWLAASRHASHIASVRGAHPRHGGKGALYIILKRGR